MAIEPGGGGKLRTKRNHGNKPYSRINAENKSIFRRVTDTVASIIVPTWMPNFMKWKSEENLTAVGSTSQPRDHIEDDVERDTKREESSLRPSHTNENNFLHPSSSRRHTNPSLGGLKSWPRGVVPATSRNELTAPEGSNDSGAYTQSMISNEFPQWSENEQVRRNENSFSLQSDCAPPSNIHLLSAGVKEPVSDNRSECSDTSVSTSGCSSMILHPDRREYQKEILQLNESSLRQLSEKLKGSCLPAARPPLHSETPNNIGNRTSIKETNSGPFISTPDQIRRNSVTDMNSPSENRIWSNDARTSSAMRHSKPQPSAPGKKPRFNIEAFQNPALNDRSILNESLISSPFYSGPTSFGGASASRRNKYQSFMPYTAPPKANRLEVRVKHPNNDFDNVDGLTSTAKKILESLEKMSTPLMDAKKIPGNKISFVDSPFLLNRTSVRRPNLTGPDPSGSLPLRRGPPATRLQIHTPKSVRKQPRLEDPKMKDASDNPKNDVPAFGWTSASSSEQSNKLPESRKMRTRQTMHYSSKQREDEMEEPLDLPQIPLPISTLPTFSFDLIKNPTVKATEKKMSSPFITFSTPPNVAGAKMHKSASEGDDGVKFVFSSPLVVSVSEPVGKPPKPLGVSTNVAQKSNFTFKNAMAEPATKPLKQKENGFDDGPSGILGPAKELKTTGSVMDFFKKSTSNKEPNKIGEGKPKEQTQKQETWACPKCSINNPHSRTNCASCDTSKPGSLPKPILDFGDKFKTPSNKWECSICCVFNEPTITKCIACGEAKLTPTPSTIAKPAVTPSNSFGDKFKMKSGNWECDTCMVSNKPEDNTCIACTTPRPGTTAPSKPAVAAPAFKFAPEPATAPPSAGFKLGVSTSSIVPSATGGFKFDSESSTSGFKLATTSESSTTSGFKFGFATSTPSSTSVASTTTTSGSAFVFGISAQDTSTAPTFSFGNKPVEKKGESDAGKEIEILGESKEDEVKVMDKDIEKTEKQATGFGIPATRTEETLSIFGGNIRNQKTEEMPTSWFVTPTKPEQISFFNPKTPEAKTAEKHKRDNDEDESEPKKKMTSKEANPSFSSLFPASSQAFIPLTTAANTKPVMPFLKALESTPASTVPSTSTVNFGIKPTIASTPALTSSTSSFLNPALTSTATPTMPIFGQQTIATTTTAAVTTATATTAPTAGFFSQPVSTATATPFSSLQSPFSGAPKIAAFGATGAPSPLFGGSSTTLTTAPAYGMMTTSGGVSGTTTTNSIFAPTSSASVLQPPSSTTQSFFGNAATQPSFTANTTAEAKSTFSTFSFGQNTTANTIPQFGSSGSIMSGTSAGSGFAVTPATTPASTSTFAAVTTPNLFTFGSQSASVFGRPVTTQATTTTPATAAPPAIGFSGFGTTPRPTFQPPQLSNSSTPAFGAAPSNRFAPSTTPSFQFGSGQANAGVFTFTGNQENAEPEPATPFQFNQQPATTQSGFQFSAGTQPSFNFGANTPNPTQNQFGSAGNQNPFNMSASSANVNTNANSQRLIRRAARRRK